VTLHGEWYPGSPVRVYLVEAFFSEAGAAESHAGWPAERELDVELEVCRRGGRELTVRLTVAAGDASGTMVRVTYGCDYQLGDDVPDAGLDARCEALVFEAASTLLYPYLREEIARLTASSRSGPYLLPFVPPPLERLPGFAIAGVTGEKADATEPREST
jgi:preprotein translocase subunit SecB